MQGGIPHDSGVDEDIAALLLADAGRGLAPSFRRALALICSDTAFLEGLPEELMEQLRSTQRRKLLPGEKRKKKPKKNATAGATDAGGGGVEEKGAGLNGKGILAHKKKKKKKRRHKNLLEVVDPVAALARRTLPLA